MSLDEKSGRRKLNDDENLLMALHFPFYDPVKGVVSRSAFKKNNTSLSRKSVLSVHCIVSVLRGQLENPDRIISGYGCIYAHEIKRVSDTSDRVDLVPTEDPTPENPSHAEILAYDVEEPGERKREVPRGVCSKLCSLVRIHNL